MAGHVILIGLSGSGKSSVGRLVAARLGRPLRDTDEAIVARAGKPIDAIFRDEGEAHFRALERAEVLCACAARRPSAICLGGGAIVDPASRAAATAGNLVVRLDAPPEVLLARLRAAPGAEVRPLLQGDDPLGRLRTMAAAREHAYAVADLTIDTAALSPEQVADRIVAHVASHAGAPA